MTRRADKKGRSKGSLAPFAAMEHYVKNSLAYRKLPSTARAAYIEVLACYDGSNNGKIALSARELGDKLGMDKSTASRAIERLQWHGFVHVTQRSCFQLKLKLSAEYRLNAFKCDKTGEPASKLFMRWTPEIQNTVAWAQLCGCTSATVDKKRRRKQTEQLHQRNREGPFDPVHGCTSAPHLESAIGSAATHTALNAQLDAARQGASVTASPLDAKQNTSQFNAHAIREASPPKPSIPLRIDHRQLDDLEHVAAVAFAPSSMFSKIMAEAARRNNTSPPLEKLAAA